jgi:hypothetical protein
MMKNSNLMTRVALTLLVMMLTATTAWADDSGSCGNGVTYYYNESTHTLTISGSGAMRNFIFGVPTDVPWYLYREEIKTVNIEDGVTSISDYAFNYCSSLESVSLPNSLTNIGDHAFYACSSLKSVDIPDGVTSIGTRIFMFCSSLESVRIPDNVTSIGESAFNACSSLKSIEIPDGVTNIGIFAFGGCLSLMSVSLPNSLTSIGESTFHACSSLKSIEIPDGVTNIGENAFCECTALTSVSLPNSVTSIGKSAFYNCSGLTSIAIPSSVTSIGSYAFGSCSGLASVVIPSSVTSIGQGAFSACSSLKYVFVNAKTPPMIGDGVFFNNIDSRKIYVPSSSVDPYKKNWSNYANDIVDVSVLFSQDGDTYTIHNNLGWEVFCDALQDNDTYNRFTGKTVVLGADITVTRMAGSGGHEFCGTFDGDGHTLTVQYGTANAPIEQQQFVAPFVETARNTSPVFRNLTIDGNIHVKYADSSVEPGVGGLIGHLFGNVKVEHCVSNVVINSDKDRVGGFVGLCEYAVTFTDCKSSADITCTGSGGGFVGWSRASAYTIAFEGCLFDGKLLKKDGVGEGNGGFVGWKGNTKTVNINNCLVALDDVKAMATYHSSTFARNNNYPPNITNSYYTTAFGTAQGTQVHSIKAGEGVSVAMAGNVIHEYETSGITFYDTGIVCDGKLYAVKDDVVSLTLSHDSSLDDSFLGYEAKDSLQNAATLTPAGDKYTLTMPDDDVTVTANVMLYSLTLPDGMEVVSAAPAAIGGKYLVGTTVRFKLKSEDYVLDGDVKNGDKVLTADADGSYIVKVGNADITITASFIVTLSGDMSYTAQDGDVLRGSTSGTVTIADGASITLSDVTINGGIVCLGTATITLVGKNVVGVTSLADVLNYKSAGIQIGGSGTTLTIKGDGSLSAKGGNAAAGIGLGRTWDANATGGSVVIEGGTVTASGGNGIGTGTVGNSMTAHMDGIIIKGGTVNARLGKGTINYGSSVTIGAIKIYDTIDKVDASAITESVTYMHVDGNTETDVTASTSTYFTIIEDGDHRIIEKKDDTDYTITIADDIEHGSIACAAETAKYGEKVTITATPDFGYRLSRLVVKDPLNNDVESTGNSFFMPKSNVTVSAVFEQGTHGTTEFAWSHSSQNGYITDAIIYDGVTTVNLQLGQSYQILILYDEYSYREFLLDNNTYSAIIPYSSGTGTFPEYKNGTNFIVDNNAESGYYDITMTDVGNGKWNVSILKTAGQMDVVPDQTYTGSAITPEPLVIAGSLSLTKGTDYVYSYKNNTNAGTATVRATFQGDYASLGYVEKEFTILNTITLVNEEKHGTVTVAASAKCGESVAITVTPDNGYMLDTIEVKDANGNEVELDEDDMSFTMPDSNVTIRVTWKLAGMKGDVNRDGTVDISDVVALVNIILNGSSDYQAEADVNNDEGIDISDVVALVNIILGQ